MKKLSVVSLVAVIFTLTAVLALLSTGTFAQPGAEWNNTPPTALGQSVDIDQDTEVEIILGAEDPDPGQGTDYTLSFRIESTPSHGHLLELSPHHPTGI